MDYKLTTQSQELLAILHKLRLHGMAKAFENQLFNESAFAQIPFEQRFHDLIAREVAEKDERKYMMLLKKGNIKAEISFQNINFGLADGISADDLAYLTGGNWYFIRRANIVIQGPCGCGKTTLACCLLNNMARQGLSVRFMPFYDLRAGIHIRLQDPVELEKFKDQLLKYDVLCLDDFGIEPLDEATRQVLFYIVDKRWDQGHSPLIWTSQKELTDYRSILGSDTRAEAVIDRLLKPCKIITLVGASKRPILK